MCQLPRSPLPLPFFSSPLCYPSGCSFVSPRTRSSVSLGSVVLSIETPAFSNALYRTFFRFVSSIRFPTPYFLVPKPSHFRMLFIVFIFCIPPMAPRLLDIPPPSATWHSKNSFDTLPVSYFQVYPNTVRLNFLQFSPSSSAIVILQLIQRHEAFAYRDCWERQSRKFLVILILPSIWKRNTISSWNSCLFTVKKLKL